MPCPFLSNKIPIRKSPQPVTKSVPPAQHQSNEGTSQRINKGNPKNAQNRERKDATYIETMLLLFLSCLSCVSFPLSTLPCTKIDVPYRGRRQDWTALRLHLMVRPIPYHQPLDFMPAPPRFSPSPAICSLPAHVFRSKTLPEVMGPEWHPPGCLIGNGRSHMRLQSPTTLTEKYQIFLACSSNAECSMRRSRRHQVLFIQLHGRNLLILPPK